MGDVKKVGKGIKLTRNGSKLTIEIDLNANHGMSKSGKSITVASTLGNVDVGNGCKMGLNVYRPNDGGGDDEE